MIANSSSSKSISNETHEDRHNSDPYPSKIGRVITKVKSSMLPPCVNTWRRNSTPKPFALSIFSNWNVNYSPINDSDAHQNSMYHSVPSSRMSRDFALKSIQLSSDKIGYSSASCDHHYHSATEASSDFSIELLKCKRMRIYDNEEDERESKRFRFSDLHGKPVKNLVEIFTAVEEGEITV